MFWDHFLHIIHAMSHRRDLILFQESFHGDTGPGLGASHQTGWTTLEAKLLQQTPDAERA